MMKFRPWDEKITKTSFAGKDMLKITDKKMNNFVAKVRGGLCATWEECQWKIKVSSASVSHEI